MTKSKTAKITVKAASVTLIDYHMKKSGEVGADKEARNHETSTGEGVRK